MIEVFLNFTCRNSVGSASSTGSPVSKPSMPHTLSSSSLSSVLSPEATSESDLAVLQDSGTRTWKKMSMVQNRDAIRVLDEERKKRVALEEWKAAHVLEVEKLKQEVKKFKDKYEREKKHNAKAKEEVEQVKEKLVNTTVELMQLKDFSSTPSSVKSTPEVTPTASPKPKSRKNSNTSEDGQQPITTSTSNDPTPPDKFRSWNKRLIYDMQGK